MKPDQTLVDFQNEWGLLLTKAKNNFHSLTRSERVWFTVECLINNINNGGLISHYYNSGADYNQETIDDLKYLGFDKFANGIRKISLLFDNGNVPVDINLRNEIIDGWPEGENDSVFEEFDRDFYAGEEEIEQKLVAFIKANIIK